MKTMPSLLVFALALTLLAMPTDSRGQATSILTTLYTLPGIDGGLNDLGDALVQGSDGNFYGTAFANGSSNYGTVFRITPAGAFTILHNFTGTDGEYPFCTLVQGSDGNFYGTTYYGGASGSGGIGTAEFIGSGTVFSITPTGTLTTLHSFGVPDGNGKNVDGAFPFAGVIQASDGNFYGTTFGGGSSGDGTVFKITPAGVLTTLHSFTAVDPANENGDGGKPESTLVQGSDGNFYGTTYYGGSSGDGTVFKITPAGVLTTLHSFAGGTDGANPEGALIQGGDGHFYGTTPLGNNGTVFKITPAGVLTTLYTFGSTNDDVHGFGPYAALVQGSDGNLYGTTGGGGGGGVGTIFSIPPDGSTLTTLQSFPGAQGGGENSALIQGRDGSFYGTSAGDDPGMVFKLTISPTITSPAIAMAYAGQVFSYQITATFNPTSYNVQGLPAGLTLNPTTGLISGTPSTTGNYSLTLKAYNAAGTGTAPLTLTFPVPVITSPTTATVYDGVPFSYQITATNNPTGYGAFNLPAGLTLNTSTGLISGTTTDQGTFMVTLTASNSNGFGEGTLSLTAEPLPAPSITTSATVTAYVGEPFSLQITATANPTSFGAQNLPAGLMVNTATGLISGVPTAMGTSSVTLSATNAVGTGTASLGLSVVLPPAPAINSAAAATGYQGAAFSYQIAATNHPTGFGAANLPAGLSVDASTGIISGKPTAATGTYSVTLSATNAGGTGNAPLSVTIQPGAPVITSATTATATAGSAFAYQITATNSPTKYGESGIPAGLSINQSTGKISGTPTTPGTYPVTIAAFNAAGSGSAKLTLTVKAAAPVITSALTATATESTAFTYQITAANSPTKYGESGIPAGLAINQTTGKISGTPTTPGTYTVTIAAFNAAGSGSAKLTLTVKAAAPAITSSLSTSATAGKAFSYQITATNSPTKYGESGLPAGLSIDQTTGKISGTPTKTGTFSVTIAAFNATGSGSAKLALTVNGVTP